LTVFGFSKKVEVVAQFLVSLAAYMTLISAMAYLVTAKMYTDISFGILMTFFVLAFLSEFLI
jgi:hypothetical protein